MNRLPIAPGPSWVAPRLTVFVAGAGRSGSNLLCSAMGNTGLLGHPDEWLNLREMRQREPGSVSTAADCCDLLRQRGTTANGIAATKLLANHYLRLDGALRLVDWFPTQSWIYLRRRDRLGQAISRTIAVQTGVWAARGTVVHRKAPAYSREQIDTNLRQVHESEQLWADYFAAEGIEPLNLWYEDLEKDVHGGILSVAAHVGGETMVTEIRQTPPFTKGAFDLAFVRQRDATNAEWRIRYSMGS